MSSIPAGLRSALLIGASLMLTGAVIGNAYYQRQQFYPSVVYITKSNASMAVIYVQAFVMVILLGKVMRKIFFGSLRAAEFEHLMERSWYAVTETCLAFTVFKDDFSPKFVALFTLLLFLRSFHWLLEDRVDFMERSPSISPLFHLRVISLAVILATLDGYFILHAYQSTLTKGASVQLVFGFEYAVLLTIIANTLVKYALHSVDLHSENPWDSKAVFMLYTELAVGFVKVLLYALFVVIMVRIYTLPLFAVRPMYLTMRAFKKALNDVILSRRAIHNMNTWYPDATQEELNNTDNVCIICREEMLSPTTKKLPCNHIFHKSCLRSWFQRQQTCPTCRLDVLRAPVQARPRTRRQQQQQAQQAQRARRQQQQAMPPPFPGFDQYLSARLAAAAAANARPGGPFPGGVPPPQPGQAGTGQPTAEAPSGSGGIRFMPHPNPFVLPFFPPPPLFNLPPPPMPPPNFAGLTQAELEAMEGTERQNVEARIKVLRNVQVLLDAAVMEMNQYSTVVNRLNINIPAAVNRTATVAGSTVNSSQEPTVTEEAAAASTTPAANDSSVSTSAATASSTSSATAVPSTSGAFVTPEETGAKPKSAQATHKEEDDLINRMDEEKLSEEQQEIRRRRLEKFAKENNQQ